MSNKEKSKAGRPKMSPEQKAKMAAGRAAKNVKAAGNAEKALTEIISTSSVPRKTIEAGIKHIEDLEGKRANINTAIKDQYAALKKQGIASRPLKFVVGIRRWEKDVQQNFAEDVRIIVDACDDMKQSDLFGAQAIRTFQAGEKASGATSAKLGAPNPEDSAKRISAGHDPDEQSPLAPIQVSQTPRRVGEVVN